uniref:Uncharacterized protein n=1 Tax=virus sp. ctrcb4 TaxID=2825824 RepID=A0A8S5RPT1_9VIRU|nr:MAG TPA: hypothetical protein [virus sp. ctrcb4]DAR12803.1 MAG TPA: hypothetical protein [Crassvirales sp.]
MKLYLEDVWMLKLLTITVYTLMFTINGLRSILNLENEIKVFFIIVEYYLSIDKKGII